MAKKRHITWRRNRVDVKHQKADFVDYTSFDGKPVELTGWSDVVCRGVARVFGARGRDFRLVPPHPTRNFVIYQNLQNCFKLFTKFYYLKNKIQFSVGQFLVLGAPSGPNMSIFLEDHVFCQCGGTNTPITGNNDFFEKQTKMIL